MTRYLAPLLFGLIGAAILISLGSWQLRRLEWKEAVLADIDARIEGEAQPLPTLISPTEQRYMPVALKGEILPGEIRVLVSQKQVGAGYRIISPFRTEGGRLILLDRGFTASAQKDAIRYTGPAEATGNLHWPDERNSSTPENDITGNIWFARDIGAMAEELQTEPLLVVARSTSPGDPDIQPLPVSRNGIPNDHLQYAITWFSLAVVWLIMTGYYIRRQSKTGKA
ncbi:cytochrome oxidase biogenesis protein Surf1, facilitates heme A insertion [Salipiger sp. CCB-MM3]|uniref:SURF1 family protein n=1 Tax=Salipiger sp. CCB-MM3 TaxID=1792508 RepID=UPI00080A9C28|nr:SURF1 family protein [Salipiger sp. CCB-MM3]ANT61726.1 cytochrome oxidase biogenesis protein Surf1, facilitates heme A insertion [Salipiger sp. CCB-MM3]